MTDVSEVFAHVTFDPNGCWTWDRARTKAGYGEANLNGRIVLVHRILYTRVHGDIPDHLELDHLCRNRACCNPFHLELVTHRENVLRGESPPARLARATHCIAGHEFTPENTIYIQGGRRCRECKMQRDRESYRRRFGLRGNAQSRKIHCPRGHPYDGQNTYQHNGRRHCRTCMRERALRRRNGAAAIES